MLMMPWFCIYPKHWIPTPNQFLISSYSTSREAKFAKAVDCIGVCIRNIKDTRKNKKDGFDEALIRSKYMPHVSNFNVTLGLFENLKDILKDQGKV